jgi:hypothetical protein
MIKGASPLITETSSITKTTALMCETATFTTRATFPDNESNGLRGWGNFPDDRTQVSRLKSQDSHLISYPSNTQSKTQNQTHGSHS